VLPNVHFRRIKTIIIIKGITKLKKNSELERRKNLGSSLTNEKSCNCASKQRVSAYGDKSGRNCAAAGHRLFTAINDGVSGVTVKVYSRE